MFVVFGQWWLPFYLHTRSIAENGGLSKALHAFGAGCVSPGMRWTLLLLACAMAWGQEFEVASIKRAPPPDLRTDRLGCWRESPGLLVCGKAQVSHMVYYAFDIKADRLKFTPDTDGFDIHAKIPAGASDADVRKMLQNLLAVRFHLQCHSEPMVREFYELTIAKGGLKMRESTGEAPAVATGGTDDEGFPIVAPPSGYLASPRSGTLARYAGTQVPMSVLASNLRRLQKPVVDATGLQGKYDINITFTRESIGEANPADQGPGLTIFEALEKKLGLKLTLVKRPVDVLVIDSYEKTSFEN